MADCDVVDTDCFAVGKLVAPADDDTGKGAVGEKK